MLVSASKRMCESVLDSVLDVGKGVDGEYGKMNIGRITGGQVPTYGAHRKERGRLATELAWRGA